MLSKSTILLKLKRGKSVIEDIALNSKIIPGHQNYTKFIILCRSRTGSNLLLNQLQFHKNVRVFYEIFSQDKSPKEFWDYINYDIQDIRKLKQNNPIKFLDSFVFREMPFNVEAVGFKLFYYHAKQGKSQEIWQYLQDQPELKIIHLVRKNLLETYASKQIALATNSWYIKNGERVKNNPVIKLDYKETIKAFEQTRKLEAEKDTFFQNYQILKIFYEDLVKDNLAEMEKIQKFLDVKPTPVSISTQKRSPQSLQQIIQNYSELKQSFQETPYASFFE